MDESLSERDGAEGEGWPTIEARTPACTGPHLARLLARFIMLPFLSSSHNIKFRLLDHHVYDIAQHVTGQHVSE